MDASTPLVPQPKVWLRVTILALLIALASIGTSPWFAKLAFCLAMFGFFGTFPRPRINAIFFETEWFAFFVPVYRRRTDLAEVVQIETDVQTRIGMDTGILLSMLIGLQSVLMLWLADWLIPWFGGDYKLLLRTKSDQRVLAWQGNGESNFRRNLEILGDVSGLSVTRG
jgi:hypothetical protein